MCPVCGYIPHGLGLPQLERMEFIVGYLECCKLHLVNVFCYLSQQFHKFLLQSVLYRLFCSNMSWLFCTFYEQILYYDFCAPIQDTDQRTESEMRSNSCSRFWSEWEKTHEAQKKLLPNIEHSASNHISGCLTLKFTATVFRLQNIFIGNTSEGYKIINYHWAPNDQT